VNGLPKTVTRQRRGCDLNPGLSAPESSTLTTRLPSQPGSGAEYCNERVCLCVRVCLFTIASRELHVPSLPEFLCVLPLAAL